MWNPQGVSKWGTATNKKQGPRAARMVKTMQRRELLTCVWQECHDPSCLDLPRQMSVHLSLQLGLVSV